MALAKLEATLKHAQDDIILLVIEAPDLCQLTMREIRAIQFSLALWVGRRGPQPLVNWWIKGLIHTADEFPEVRQSGRSRDPGTADKEHIPPRMSQKQAFGNRW